MVTFMMILAVVVAVAVQAVNLNNKTQMGK